MAESDSPPVDVPVKQNGEIFTATLDIAEVGRRCKHSPMHAAIGHEEYADLMVKVFGLDPDDDTEPPEEDLALVCVLDRQYVVLVPEASIPANTLVVPRPLAVRLHVTEHRVLRDAEVLVLDYWTTKTVLTD